VIPAVPALQSRISEIARARKGPRHLTIVTGQSHAALAGCDVALVASGTAALEAALFKRPMVIGYRMQSLSWRLMRRKQLQPWVGLPNILCGEFVVPELLQDAATPEALAAEVLRWLRARDDSSPTIEALEQRFTALHHLLRRDTARLAADAIQKVVSST
jgi:lipid-A-disaccharide synthase